MRSSLVSSGQLHSLPAAGLFPVAWGRVGYGLGMGRVVLAGAGSALRPIGSQGGREVGP